MEDVLKKAMCIGCLNDGNCQGDCLFFMESSKKDERHKSNRTRTGDKCKVEISVFESTEDSRLQHTNTQSSVRTKKCRHCKVPNTREVCDECKNYVTQFGEFSEEFRDYKFNKKLKNFLLSCKKFLKKFFSAIKDYYSGIGI